MCYNRVDCRHFIESPFNRSACLLYCSRNPDVIEKDYAYDFYNPSGDKVMVKIILRENKNNTQATTVTEEFGEVDKFIKMMNDQKQPSITDLKRSEAKAIIDSEGELLQKPEPSRRPVKTLLPSEVMKNMQQKMKEKEKKIIEESETEHDEQEIRDKIEKIQRDLNVAKIKGLSMCQYCKKEFKRLDAHIKWCKLKPAGEE